jgi:hypothetical protein
MCPSCWGALEASPDGTHARCAKCLAIYGIGGGQLVAAAQSGDPVADMDRYGFPGLPGAMGMPHYGSVKIGGMPIDMVARDGRVNIDMSRAEQAIGTDLRNAITGKIWGCVITLGILAAMMGVLGATGLYVWWHWNDKPAPASGATPAVDPAVIPTATHAPVPAVVHASAWNGRTPFACSTESLKVEGVVANLPNLAGSPAIDAHGNCVLELDAVTLDAPVAIQASGNAHVTLRGGRIHGTTMALTAQDNATIDVLGATVQGTTKASENGQIHGIPGHPPHRP